MQNAFKAQRSITPKEVAFTQSSINVMEVRQSDLLKENARLEKEVNERKRELDRLTFDTANKIDEARTKANEILSEADAKKRQSDRIAIEVQAKSGVLDQKIIEANALQKSLEDTQKTLSRRIQIARETEADADAKMLKAESLISEAQKQIQEASIKASQVSADRATIDSQRQAFFDEMHEAKQTIEKMVQAKKDYSDERQKSLEEKKALEKITDTARADLERLRQEREGLARERQQLDLRQLDLNKEAGRLASLNAKIVEQKTFVDLEERRVRRMMELKGLKEEVQELGG